MDLPLIARSLILALAIPLFGGEARAQGGHVRPATGPAITDLDPALAFLAPYGLQNFSPHYVRALQTLLDARERYWAQEYGAAQAKLDALWARYPVGSTLWGLLPSKPFGLNLGTPPCYSALRILSDMTDWRVNNPNLPPAPRTARLTVLLVGATHGLEPQNQTDLLQGTGVPVTHTLDPRVEQNDYRAVHQSLRLFREYALAMTEGRLAVETHLLPLPNLDLPVHAYQSGGFRFAGLVNASQVFASVPPAEIEATDWWWILYPSHVPEQHPDFQNTEFITGGMGAGADSLSPFFIIDDRSVVRKPPHLGRGEYSDIERTVYLPQWLQHEFFHFLFRTYPEFGLEATPHQWFDRSTWPPDFVGRYESDYYHEALVKRLQQATPGLQAGLRFATAGAPWNQLIVTDLLGTYRHEPVQNPWHIGDIRFAGPQLQWRNTAPVSWNLYEDILHGVLTTGPDCPYYTDPAGRQFHIVLERDALGDLTTEVRGFAFLGGLYQRQ
jgi:hypothetical protein